MPQSRNAAYPRYQKKERRRTSYEKTNVTYKAIDARNKVELQPMSRLGTVSITTTKHYTISSLCPVILTLP